MKCENCYISSNCNPAPTICDWGRNNLICYGSCNSIMIYAPNVDKGGQVINTFVGHKKRVNSVKWIKGNDTKYETEFISGSADGTAIVWNLNTNNYIKLEGHTCDVNIVDGLYKNEYAVLVTASMDSTVIIWYRKNADEVLISQSINLGHGVCVGLKMSQLPNSQDFVLALALDNFKIKMLFEGCTNTFESQVDLIGHEDWVRGLDFKIIDNDFILATSSQDCEIRLWKFVPGTIKTDSVFQREIFTDRHRYSVFLESVLSGHEGWVYSVNWSPTSLELVSASIDRTIIVWEWDNKSLLWLETGRVGEFGGNTLGFFGAIFGPEGDSILVHSYNGALRMYNIHKIHKYCLSTVTVGGHFGEVVDLSWEPGGEFLVTVSADQTTRIHAPWKNNNKVTWHQIARPQIHGYDMSSIAMLSRYHFASSSEEKVIRTFQAPRNFVENFRSICNISDDIEGDTLIKSSQLEPEGAAVPSLGLSNKAVYSDDITEESSDKNNQYPELSHFNPVTMDEPPSEGTLVKNTLWPEVQKLYGHGYEVYTLTSSPDGKFLASACKSTTPEHAAIILWETTSWQIVQKLHSHTLTVVQMQFSPDSKHLLSVSRDRRWSLFTKDAENRFNLTATTDKKTSIHTRIIWCCSWTHDSKYFVTGSREGKVVIWTLVSGKPVTSVLGPCEAVSEAITVTDSVNALAFAPNFVNGSYLLSVGLETGIIILYSWSVNECTKLLTLTSNIAHHLTVNRLAFRPIFGQAGHDDKDNNCLQLASCSADHSVRIYNIFIGQKC